MKKDEMMDKVLEILAAVPARSVIDRRFKKDEFDVCVNPGKTMPFFRIKPFVIKYYDGVKNELKPLTPADYDELKKAFDNTLIKSL